ncbi:tRNA (guanine(46)-N(7))-methyltransferase TrmB [Aureimonas psammosilenae]|uniref:tRNA (guanine(46)-N(7))-methyltransferase TrmB n=1 Tax=Aureimonas psammosilenae TaxID=2495496 RepID=UPI0012608C5D|nr:tRNA (guanine(46)-N(7))-methyltransferase TrmB [Aureimonas psammosilenae]
MSEENEAPSYPKRRREAFFGRVMGKTLRPNQAEIFDRLLPTLAVDLSQPAPANLADLFPMPVDEVRLEIGYGGGEHLLSMADRFPGIGFLGAEAFRNGIAKLLADVEEKARPNLRLHADDATILLDWLPEGSLGGVDLFYPDPWPKRRHWKRRFVSEVNLDRLARAVRPGGLFRFASDIDTYVDWTLRHVRDHGGFEWTAETSADWHRPFEGWPGTRYEAKAFREGRKAAYLTFKRRDARGA